MLSGSLSGSALEQQEELLLPELRQNRIPDEKKEIISALAKSGTTLAVPTLLGIIKNNDGEFAALARIAIINIKERARKRGSILPDEYYTIEHWKLEWEGSKNLFLSYVSALAYALVKSGDIPAEIDRIGDILVVEMGIDMSPCNTFTAYRLCATDWDFEKDYELILDRIEQERALDQTAALGITESWNTFFVDNLRDLQYDYLLTRLRLGGDPKYQRFVLKIAECLNGKND